MNYDKIDVLRKKKGISQKVFSSMINMTENGYIKMRDKGTASVETIEKIAQILEVSVCEFFDCESKQTVDQSEYKQKYFELLEKDHANLELIMKLTDEINQYKKNHR
jgi:transcriptional regulator with XRE-family HTH domain